ncbi:MAG TPA: PspC domain-containing protein [Acidimicrobiia bacterium]|nr:PspC domain-containing protein [Acidimicrobiia bacterium]
MEPELPSDPSPGPEPAASADPVDDAPAGDAAGDVPTADAPAEPAPPAEPGDAAPPAAVWVPSFQVLRSRTDRKLGGVAGGLAAATELDPVLVRFAVVLGCLTGWGILLYLVAWAVIPEEDPSRGRVMMPAPERTGKHLRIGLAVLAGLGVLHVIGAVLGVLSSALIGLGLFPARVFGLGHRRFVPGEAFLGLVLLVGGFLLLFRRHLPWVPADGPGTGPWPGTGSGGAPPAGPASGDPASGGPAGPTGPAAFAGPSAAGPGGAAPSWGPAAGGPAATPAPRFGARASAAARAAVTNGPLLLVRAVGWLVGLWFLAAAIVGGVLWLTGAVHLHLPVIPIAAGIGALGLLGYTLLRTRRPAAVVGAMAVLLVPAGLASGLGRLDGQAGHRSVTPTTLSDLQPAYRHAAGLFELDLSRLSLPAGQTPIRLTMGAGKIDVTVPWDADVDVTASVGAGTFELFGNRQSGVNLDGRTHSAGQPGAPALVLRTRAGAGDIEVRRATEPFTHEALRTGRPVPLQCVPTTGTAMRCSAADGVTPVPALGCVVTDSGAALCRPAGEPEPTVSFANDPGTRHCQVPAGGGDSTCTAPVAGSMPATPAPTPTTGPTPTSEPAAPTAPTPPGAPPGQYLCTIPDGGGPATCRPA